jgi:hypothetical protein
MNLPLIIAVTWIGKEYRFLGLDWSYLVVLGLIGNAIFSMLFRLRAARRECNSSVVLVLEHRRQRRHVPLLRFQKGPGWHSSLSSPFDGLHPQFDVEKSISLAKELTKLAERAGLILQVGRWLFSNVPQSSV